MIEENGRTVSPNPISNILSASSNTRNVTRVRLVAFFLTRSIKRPLTQAQTYKNYRTNTSNDIIINIIIKMVWLFQRDCFQSYLTYFIPQLRQRCKCYQLHLSVLGTWRLVESPSNHLLIFPLCQCSVSVFILQLNFLRVTKGAQHHNRNVCPWEEFSFRPLGWKSSAETTRVFCTSTNVRNNQQKPQKAN